MRRRLTESRLTYVVHDLKVPGDLDLHTVQVTFTKEPPPWASGIPACDYPRVTTNVVRERLHVNGDGSLCMWAPFDPPARRWWHRDGLHSLVEVTRRHLFLENHWWRTGATKGGEWPVPDAPHGTPDDGKAA